MDDVRARDAQADLQGPGPTEYDAFLSYSSGASGPIAAALQRWLERFATPWYKRRSLRIFRDATSLSAGDLGGNLIRAMGRSRWFILLASPQAAASPWVNKEVGWWRANRSPERAIVVLTAGRLAWDDETGDWDHELTDAVPPAARGMFPAEPLWIDLTRASSSAGVDGTDPELQAIVGRIAAPLRGVDKDALVGEHITLLRRARRQRTGGVIALALLLVISLAATAIATRNAIDLRAQAKVVQARALAAASGANLESRFDLALLLAVEAYRSSPDPASRAALFQAVTGVPSLQRFLWAPAAVTEVAGAEDGSIIVAGTESGAVVRWDAGAATELGRLDGPVVGLSVSRDGAVVAATSDTTTLVWSPGRPAATLDVAGARSSVAASPSGRTVAVVVGPPTFGDAATLTVLDVATGDTADIAAGSQGYEVVVPSDDEVVLFDGGYGTWQRYSVPGLQLQGEGGYGFGVHNRAATISPDGSVITYTNGGSPLPLWRTEVADPSDTDNPLQAVTTGPYPTALALSGTARLAATASNGAVVVAPVTPTGHASDEPVVELRGLSRVNPGALRFLDDRTLLAASGQAVVTWDLTRVGRMVRRTAATIPIACGACPEPTLAISADRAFATAEAENNRVTVLNLGSGTESLLDRNTFVDRILLSWYGPAHELVAADLRRGTVDIIDAAAPTGPRRLGTDPDPPTDALRLFAAADGTLVYLRPNEISVRDALDGRALKTIGLDVPPASRNSDGTISVDATAFDPTGSVAAVAYRDSVRIVDLVAGEVATLPVEIERLALSAGRLMVKRTNGDVEVYAVDDLRLLRNRPGVGGPAVGAMAASADGATLAVQQGDGSILLWDMNTGEDIGAIAASWNPGYKVSLAFEGDGRTLAVAVEGSDSSGGEFQEWNLDAVAWVERACATAGRDLTAQEWRRYVGTDPPGDLRCTRD